jgi:hypothetical protein
VVGAGDSLAPGSESARCLDEPFGASAARGLERLVRSSRTRAQELDVFEIRPCLDAEFLAFWQACPVASLKSSSAEEWMKAFGPYDGEVGCARDRPTLSANSGGLSDRRSTMRRFSHAVAVIGATALGLAGTALAQSSDATPEAPKASLQNTTTKTPVTPRTSFQTTETRGTSQKGKSTVPKTSFDTTETKSGGNPSDKAASSTAPAATFQSTETKKGGTGTEGGATPPDAAKKQ